MKNELRGMITWFVLCSFVVRCYLDAVVVRSWLLLCFFALIEDESFGRKCVPVNKSLRICLFAGSGVDNC